MAIIISKSIAGYRRRRRAAAAARGEPHLSPDGPGRLRKLARNSSAGGRQRGGQRWRAARARMRRSGRHPAPRPAGRAARVVEAADRDPAARGPEETGQVSRPVVIEVHGLRKSYDGVEAVAGIGLEVRAGEVFAFLGPNGAGKPVTGLRHSFPAGKRPPCAG